MIHIDYCSTWTLADAQRELFQNALDAGLQKYSSNCLVNKGSLPVAAFIMGYSSKRDDSSSLGQFGEGLKLAMLVYEREGQPIFVRSNGRTWTTERLVVSGETVVTVVDVGPTDVYDYTEIEFSAPQDWSNTYIAPKPRVLKNNPELYVGGLHICSLKGKFVHGYVLAPGSVSLNRDRKAADAWEIAYEAKQLLLASLDFSDIELARLVIDADHMDGNYLSNVKRLERAVLDLLDSKNIRPQYHSSGYYTGITSAAASYIRKGTVLTKEQKRLQAVAKHNKRRMSKEARQELQDLIGKLHA